MKFVFSLLIIAFLGTVIQGSTTGENPNSELVLENGSEKSHCSTKCYPAYKYKWLKNVCSYGVKECKLWGKYHYPKYGYSCYCPPKSPPPSPSSSPKPKCYGYLYKKCFPAHKYWYLKKVCPYGIEHCYTHYGPGYKCKCIYKPPPPPPSKTPTPTPSSKPKPKCYGHYYDRCYPKLYSSHCPYGKVKCTYYDGHVKKYGYKCKCIQHPSPPDLKCPAYVSLFTKARTTEYKIDLKKTSGCFNIDYSFYHKPYTIFVFYEGETLIKDRVNYAPKTPVKLCYHGYTSYIFVKINSGLYEKIDFKIYCPFKGHYY